MSGLSRDSPTNRGYYAESSEARALTIRRLRTPTAHIYFLRIISEGGASPKVAQRQLRHSDPRVTLEIYAHLVEGTHREAVEKLASFLAPSGPNEEGLPLRIQ
jgi:hypothetical protein